MTTVGFVLVHSPFTGPSVWQETSDELARRGFEVAVPALRNKESVPYWRSHAVVVAESVFATRSAQVVLAGHSGAGPLLPAAADRLDRALHSYVFVDATLPRDGQSRLDIFDEFEPGLTEEFRAAAVEGLLLPWTEDVLRKAIPDDQRRRRVAAELRPLPLAVYEEPIPVPDGWPDARCAYLHFSSTYDPYAAEALRRGWRYTKIEGDHFHMVVDPGGVADALVELAGVRDS